MTGEPVDFILFALIHNIIFLYPDLIGQITDCLQLSKEKYVQNLTGVITLLTC